MCVSVCGDESAWMGVDSAQGTTRVDRAQKDQRLSVCADECGRAELVSECAVCVCGGERTESCAGAQCAGCVGVDSVELSSRTSRV